MSTDLDTLRADPAVQQLLAAERVATADRIATELARKACSPMCEDAACTSYRYAAYVARQHGAGLRVPRQTGPRP